jgi:hypothetical protein
LKEGGREKEREEGGKGRRGEREQVMKGVKEGERKRGINRVGDRRASRRGREDRRE